MNPSDAIEAIEKPLSSLPYSLSRHILEHLRKLTSHEPVIGIMGKSGAGKSSLCNALFQGEVTPVSDVHAGTREVQRFRLSGHGHSMVITDLPGVGESRDRDAEYEALYRDILPELDLVLWLIKADDRALSVDEYFWRHILHRGHQQVLFVVTQADKTEPCHEWDVAGIQPSPAQARNIREKTEAVFRLFRPVHPVVAVSARTGWELDTLVSALMTALPDHAASPLMTRLQDELCTESVRSQAREQFTGAVDRIQSLTAVNNSTVTTDVTAQCGTALKLTGSTVLNGAIDPTNVTLASGATWNIPDNATVQSVVDDLSHAGQIHFTSTRTGKFVPATLKVKNLNGQNGTISLRVRPDMAQNNADRLVIDGGRATGKTILNLVNAGNSASGLATTGKGIRVVEAINGATTEEGAFVQGNRLQAGAFNYSLNRDSDESWYLRSENVYRAEVPLYASMLTQAMDYDRILAGSRSHQTGVNGENNSVRLSIQGGHLGHDNNGGIARGVTPESSGSYGFVRLEGDLLRTEVAGMSVTAGVYGAAGHSSVDVKDDDGSRAGTVRDDAGSLGGYLNLVHTSSGLWADIVAQGTRHSMKASSDNNDFRPRGRGWLGSLETGLPFSITDNLMLEPQLQYTWQGLSLDDGRDSAGYVKFGHGSAQHVRAGFRLGSHNDMSSGKGTSSRDTLRDSARHSVRELPVNGWVQPSVIRTFSSRGDMSTGTATAGSNMTFSPSRNGTSLDLQAGLEARVRENITLGVQAGYAHSVSGSSAEGYNGQATLNVTF